MPNPNNFYLDSDYPMDKIVYFKSGTFTPSSGSFTYAHNLGFRPFLFGIYSPTPDFATTYSFNVPVVGFGSFGSGAVNVLSDDTNIMFYIPNNVRSGLPGTYYYRLFGFQKYIQINTDFTSQNAEKFILNSDYSYYKLYMSDEVAYTGSSSVTVHHGLGYIPYVLTWGDSLYYSAYHYPVTSQIIQSNDTSSQGQRGIIVNENDVTFNLLGDTYITDYSKIYYRIYYDQA